ncbi:hypothetical protein Dimus_020333 [Dionaea muscipula]
MRKGTREVKLPTKVLWMRRMHVLSRLLHKYRESKKIDKHLYMKVKGNVFKNKCVLMESIRKSKAEKEREKTLSNHFEAKRAENKASWERKFATREECLAQVVENHLPTQSLTWDSQPLPAYQYFENVRNFLMVVKELKLPAFDASDLETAILKFNGHQFGNRTIVVDWALLKKIYTAAAGSSAVVSSSINFCVNIDCLDLFFGEDEVGKMRSYMRWRPEVAWDRSGRGWIMKYWRPSDMIGMDGYAGWCCDSILWLALDPTTDVLFCLGGCLLLAALLSPAFPGNEGEEVT